MCMMVYTVGKPVLGKRTQMDPWGSLLSQTSIHGKIKVSERTPSTKAMQMVPKERLLYEPALIHTHLTLHKCVCTHIHT